MLADISKPLIFVVISVLVVALIYSPFTLVVFAGPAAPLQDGVLEQPPAAPPQPAPQDELPPCPPGEVTTTDCIPQDSSCPPGTIGTPPDCLPPCPPGEVTTTDCIPPPAEEPPGTPFGETVSPESGVLKEQIREGAIPTQPPAVPTDEVAEKKVCEYGTSATGACYPPPKCPAGTVLAPGTGGDCRPPPPPLAAREVAPEVAPEVPPEVVEQVPEETPAEETPAEEQPSEDSNSEDNGNN